MVDVIGALVRILIASFVFVVIFGFLTSVFTPMVANVTDPTQQMILGNIPTIIALAFFIMVLVIAFKGAGISIGSGKGGGL